MTPTDKNSKQGFMAWRRHLAQSRLAAIISGRKGNHDHRPSQKEIDASKERYDAIKHEI